MVDQTSGGSQYVSGNSPRYGYISIPGTINVHFTADKQEQPLHIPDDRVSQQKAKSRALKMNFRFLKTLSQLCNFNMRRFLSTATTSRATTHFGFREVDAAEKAGLVGGVFHKVAGQYDVMNDAMSFGIHRLWKHHFVSVLRPWAGMQLLDVAGGTGDIARGVVQAIRARGAAVNKSRIVVSDINSSMLGVGKDRLQDLQGGNEELEFVLADAEKLPFEANSFDAYTIAFGIRNVTNIQNALNEAYRVLKPGGRFLCLEFSKVENPVISQVYDAYSFNLIPVMGQVIANDRDSYEYLVESIRKFPDQDIFADMITKAGFPSKMVSYENLTLGVCAIHSGFKL